MRKSTRDLLQERERERDVPSRGRCSLSARLQLEPGERYLLRTRNVPVRLELAPGGHFQFDRTIPDREICGLLRLENSRIRFQRISIDFTGRIVRRVHTVQYEKCKRGGDQGSYVHVTLAFAARLLHSLKW